MGLMDDLMKKKGKLADEGMDPKYKDAKMSVLKQIAELASKSMGDDVKGLKKVSVMAPDEQGLEKGLDKAKDMLPQMSEMAEEGEEEAPEAADDELGEDESSEESSLKEHGSVGAEELIEKQIDHEADEGDLSEEELDDLIRELQEKKLKLKK